jgi:hypothetical protein
MVVIWTPLFSIRNLPSSMSGSLTAATDRKLQSRRMADKLKSASRSGLTLVGLDGIGSVCETIHRFEGLEAAAAIVVLDELADEQDRQLAYIGLSRARSFFVVFAPAPLTEMLKAEPVRDGG